LKEPPISKLTRILKSLASRGFLEQVGQKRGNIYRLPAWASLIAQAASSLAPENDEELLGIAKPARDKKKLIPTLTKTIIRRLCSDRFLTAERLGNLIERRKDKLQENFLAAMV